jgi:hypothetical protein
MILLNFDIMKILKFLELRKLRNFKNTVILKIFKFLKIQKIHSGGRGQGLARQQSVPATVRPGHGLAQATGWLGHGMGR